MDMNIWLVIWLGVAHFIADFLAQTDEMAVNKSKSWKWLTIHVVAYSVTMAILTWSFPFAVVTFVAHFLTDAATSRTSRALFPWTPVSGDWSLRLGTLPYGRFIEPCSRIPVYIDDEGKPSGPWGLGLPRSRHWFFTTIGADQWLLHWPQLVLTAYWLL